MEFSSMAAKELYSEEVISEIMSEEDPVMREQMIFDLEDRAAEFGRTVVDRVKRMLKAAERDKKEREKERSAIKNNDFDRYTDFGGVYPSMRCGTWRADSKGVYNPDALPDNRLACPHPILPVETITNVEDGTQKVRLAFKRGNRWQEHIVPKTVIANRSKIPELAGIGIAVTSETAKNLVRYLAEVEQLNFEDIPEKRATAKMGWCEDGFMPFNSSLDFDKDGRFDTLFSTIGSAGDREKYMEFVLKVRASGRVEPRLVMAAAFASVLVRPCGLLPFWVDIWGRSGGGKSVCGMFAASVWADPEIGKYISKFDSTIAAFEARAGFLNHLPFVIDDTAEIKRKLKDDFSQLIYQLASGEGRDRSNTKLGLAHKTTWANVIICSGESPLITDRLQGGAINRVLEYEVDEGDIFEDGQAAATLLRSNYGFLGKEFVDVLEKITLPKVCELQQECFNLIKNLNFEDKQLRSLSAVLVADKIATEFIFKDNKALRFDEIIKVLADKDSISENERCYEYIISECDINKNKFVTNYYGDYQGEMWGTYIHNKENHYVAIVPNVFKRICTSGGFSFKAFTSWAIKNDLLMPGKDGKYSKVVRIQQDPIRCYVLKLPDIDEEEESVTP